MTRRFFTLISVILVAAFMLVACGSVVTTQAAEAPAKEAAAPTEKPAEKVTITWWHISTKDPALSDWKKMADDYMAAHPNVTIEITVLENESFKTKLTTVMQSGEVPDIFQSWGGGTLKEQIDAGLLKDITADLDADGGAWRDTFAPVRWLCSAQTARITVCPGTWAWLAGGTTRIFLRKLVSLTHPRHGANSWLT